MGMAAILVMRPRPFIQSLVLPSQGGSTYNLALIGQAVSMKKIFENGGRTMDGQMDDGRTDGRTTDGCRLNGYTISSPREPNGSGELII